MLHVACDVCRRRYQVDEARLGTELICKECQVPFDVCRQNFVDPDEPEPKSDDPEEEPTASEWGEVWSGTVNGIGGAGIIIALGAMLMLLFRDPREAPGPTAVDVSPTVTQTRGAAWPTAPVQPRIRNRSDSTGPGSVEPLQVPPVESSKPTPADAPDSLVDPEVSSAQNPVREPEPEPVPAEQAPPVRDVQPQRPLASLTINTIDPLRVRPRRTFRVLGTGLSGVERVVLVSTDAPVSAVRSLAGFEVVSDGELRVQIGHRPGTYVLVLERADVTLVTVPADAHIVSDEQSITADPVGFVVVRDGGRFDADGVVCCLVERGGELNCPFSANWAGWFAEGAVITGHHLPPVAWTTPETDLRVTVSDRAFTVTTPSIVAADVEELVAADPSAEETAEFDGPPPGRRNLRTESARSPAGAADGKILGINDNGPDAIPSSGRRIDDATPLEVGQIVQVQDHIRWYAADVLRVNDDGTVRIHYRGWSDTWDGDVPRSRIQLAHEE